MRGEPLSDGDKELIACRMPDAVVDHFEAIEVEKQEGHTLTIRAAQDCLEPIDAQPTVGETSERVVERKVLQSGPPPFRGNVELNAVPELSAVRWILNDDRHVTQPHHTAIASDHAVFDVERLMRRYRMGCSLPNALLVIRVNECEPVVRVRDVLVRFPSQ